MGVDSIDLPAAQGYKNSFRQNNHTDFSQTKEDKHKSPYKLP